MEKYFRSWLGYELFSSPSYAGFFLSHVVYGIKTFDKV